MTFECKSYNKFDNGLDCACVDCNGRVPKRSTTYKVFFSLNVNNKTS